MNESGHLVFWESEVDRIRQCPGHVANVGPPHPAGRRRGRAIITEGTWRGADVLGWSSGIG